MNIQRSHFTFKPSEYDIFVGLDVDKKSISLTVLSNDELIKSLKMPYSSSHLIAYTRRHFADKRVVFAYEAGPTGYGLHDSLKKSGYVCQVVAPSMTPRAPGERVKTNRLDSIKLAESLRANQLKAIQVPYGCYRYLRHLAGLRQTFVQQLTAYKARCKALLLFEALAFPEVSPNSQWTAAALAELRKLPCAPPIRFKLDRLLDCLDYSAQQVLAITREMRRYCRAEQELKGNIELLMTIPGIGWIVAMHLLSRIGDWRNLKNARQLSAFLGLVPKENSTGETIRRGSITRVGDSTVRSKLIEGAWMAAYRDPELKEFYSRIYQRNPRASAARKAIVAVARKLTCRIYSVLVHQRPYIPNTGRAV